MAMDDVYSSRKGKKCVIYIRVSSERQVQGYSLEGQKRYLKEWAEFEGMMVSEIYVEPGKAGNPYQEGKYSSRCLKIFQRAGLPRIMLWYSNCHGSDGMQRTY